MLILFQNPFSNLQWDEFLDILLDVISVSCLFSMMIDLYLISLAFLVGSLHF